MTELCTETPTGPLDVQFVQFEVSDGAVVQLPKTGVTLFVGPNNAGKSQSLRDLQGLASQPQAYVGRAITSLDVEKSGSDGDFLDWVAAHIPAVRDDRGLELRQVGEYGAVPLTSITEAWSRDKLQHLGSLFIYHADATSRLTAGDSAPTINFTRDAISHPLHRAYKDAGFEATLRRASTEAFGVPLTVDRYAGNVICLRVGVPPTFEHDNGVPATHYVEALSDLPLLEQQGDGMRSYLGLLLHVIGGAHHITLVDEPEAFLHPPQASLLGQTLAKRSVGAQQLFLATHSMDIVRGVLESEAPVTIVRITRDGDVNHVAVLDPEQVREVWSDPLLRYSNLLDGLFHDAVVLCEGDADCRYYSSVLDNAEDEEDDSESRPRPSQLLFSHCGGKARMASVVESLSAISIPVVVVADFDILNDKGLLSKTVKALGGDFSDMETNWNRLQSALNSDSKPVSKATMRQAIEDIICETPGDTLDKRDAARIRGVVRVESGWDKVKRGGVSAVPGGEAHAACLELLEKLRQTGLLIVPVGELERFVPTVEGHGPSWITRVHRKGLHADPSNTVALDFVKQIVATATRS